MYMHVYFYDRLQKAFVKWKCFPFYQFAGASLALACSPVKFRFGLVMILNHCPGWAGGTEIY